MSTGSVVRLPQALGERIDVGPTVESLRALIADSEAAIERDCELPPALVEAMYEAGVFQTCHPREYGGLELHPCDYLDLVFELSRINGSVGWIAMLQNGSIPLFDHELMEELYERAGGRFIVAGSHGRIGQARRVEGGYRFTGHWAFASGSPWATYILATSHLVDDDGDLILDPDFGGPQLVGAILPKGEVNYLGGWNPLGLRGTGSGEFSLDDVFVSERFSNLFGPPSEAYADRPLFRSPSLTSTAPASLGCAQGLIDRFVELGTTKRRTNSWANRANSLGTEQMHQIAMARADATIRSARAMAWDAAARSVDPAVLEDPVAVYELGIDVTQSSTYVARVAKQAAGLIFDIAGTDSVIEGRGIERCFRDVFTATQHSVTLEIGYTGVAQFRMTRDLPDGPVIGENLLVYPPSEDVAAAMRAQTAATLAARQPGATPGAAPDHGAQGNGAVSATAPTSA